MSLSDPSVSVVCLSSVHVFNLKTRGKRKVQGVPQLQTEAFSRHQEEKEISSETAWPIFVILNWEPPRPGQTKRC